MFGLALRQFAIIMGISSSGMVPALSMAFMAPKPPPYPRASSATFPCCLSRLPFLMFSIGTWNIWAAEASYIFPWVLNTFRRHFSSASHAITLASMAEKSLTTNRYPSDGIKAVRISCENTNGIPSNSSSRVSKSSCFTRSLARSRSGILF